MPRYRFTRTQNFLSGVYFTTPRGDELQIGVAHLLGGRWIAHLAWDGGRAEGEDFPSREAAEAAIVAGHAQLVGQDGSIRLKTDEVLQLTREGVQRALPGLAAAPRDLLADLRNRPIGGASTKPRKPCSIGLFDDCTCKQRDLF